MPTLWRPERQKRLFVACGHYGSGKTEFSINLSLELKGARPMTALVDLDIANVYFRSREKQAFLESQGIAVYSNAYGYDITADLPAIAACIRAPLEDERYSAVIDAGGGTDGAKILHQFESLLMAEDVSLLIVVNANRPETNSYEKAYAYACSLMDELGMQAHAIVNNTHMLRETKTADVMKGYEICQRLAQAFGTPGPVNCCEKSLLPQLEQKAKALQGFQVFPMELHMRPTWLDR